MIMLKASRNGSVSELSWIVGAHLSQMTGTYKSDTMPVIEYYAGQGKVAEASLNVC